MFKCPSWDIIKVLKMEFVLIFDVPFEEEALKRQVNRLLNREGAKMIQQSVWKSNDLKSLIDIASLIKKAGGNARILEEKFLF